MLWNLLKSLVRRRKHESTFIRVGKYKAGDRVKIDAEVRELNGKKTRICGSAVVISNISGSGYYKISHRGQQYYVRAKCLTNRVQTGSKEEK